MAYFGKREWLRKAREAKGYSQDRTAAECGMSQGGYSRIENGYTAPTPEQRELLASFLGFDVGRFAQEDEAARRAAV